MPTMSSGTPSSRMLSLADICGTQIKSMRSCSSPRPCFPAPHDLPTPPFEDKADPMFTAMHGTRPCNDLPTPPSEDTADPMFAAMHGTSPGSISQLPGHLPSFGVAERLDPFPIAQAALIRLRLADAFLLNQDSLWRDIHAPTATARTWKGAEQILPMWKERMALCELFNFRIASVGDVSIARPAPLLSWIQVKFTFRSRAEADTTYKALMRLVPDGRGDWKIWIIITMLDGTDEFSNVNLLETGISLETEQPAAQKLTSIDAEIEHRDIVRLE